MSKYLTQKLVEFQREVDTATIIVGDINAPKSVIDRCTRWKVSKHLVELNSTINQLDSIDIYKILQHQNERSSQILLEHFPT